MSGRYANKETALYELGCGVTGLLKATHPATRLVQEDNPEFLKVAKELALAGEKAYRNLTDETGARSPIFSTSDISKVGKFLTSLKGDVKKIHIFYYFT